MARERVSLHDAAIGLGGGPSRKKPRHRRRRLPRARSLIWTPKGGSESAGFRFANARGPYEFFLRRGVLAGINSHTGAEDSESRFGFLLGHTFRCPDSGTLYAVADTAIAAREVLEEDASGAYLLRAWADAKADTAGHSGALLGWYHSHKLLGMMLSKSDEETNERYFGQPWQASIVVVPDAKRPLGGIFRHDPAAGAADRRRPSRFYELLDDAGTRAGDPESAVIWTNYEADRSLLAPTTASERPDEDFDGEDGEEIPEEELVEATATPEPAPQPAPVAARTAAPSRPALGAERPVQLVIPGDGKGSGLFPAVPRRALWPLGVFAMVMLFVTLLTVARGLDQAPATSLPSSRAVLSLEERRFFNAVEELEIAGDRYAERTADFDAGRIGCALLTTGYAAADASFVRIAGAWAALGQEPGLDAQGAFDRASARIADVNTHFDESGCPRP